MKEKSTDRGRDVGKEEWREQKEGGNVGRERGNKGERERKRERMI